MSAKALVASLAHPSELVAIVKYLSLPTPPPPKNVSPTYTLCYKFLNDTSRSFARVIQELDSELRHAVCIFYLVLRGLDTVEDDMTLPLKRKVDVLQHFHEYLYQRGWNFTESGESEKDRHLLVGFDAVIDEFLTLSPRCQEVIADITKRMGHGMAEFAELESPNPKHLISVTTVDQYNLYTHYVAGLVGIGLTQLFAASGLEADSLDTPHGLYLANRMGQFLQKVNILKDWLEDLRDGRVFWPREVWGKYVKEVEEFLEEKNRDKAVQCLNELIVDALELVPDCLEYMSLLTNRSVIRFCAIPQMMAIATLATFFNSERVFTHTGTKIRRGLAVKLILNSDNLSSIQATFRQYALAINRLNHQRVNPAKKGLVFQGKEAGGFLAVSRVCAEVLRKCDQKSLVRADSGFVDGNSSGGNVVIIVALVAVAIAVAAAGKYA
ncbi:isoprenoid synthase domain-containing protein [Gaertneriomyces semiglobifer]|nr:isoprenoid synthase domain-containing protein [Gaertneriomyces semiglobifer]